MGVWEAVSPGGGPRYGILRFETTRGDRLFLSLLGSAFIIWRSADSSRIGRWPVIVVGVLMCVFALGAPWWVGVLIGAAMVFFGTCGDLIESSIKRDVGIKDMSSILPGHGGVMDRLDSLLVAAAPAWLVMYLLIPGG